MDKHDDFDRRRDGGAYMTLRQTVLERAFEVARSGSVSTISDLMLELRKSGFENLRGQISGPSLRAQLKAAITAAHKAKN